MTDKAFGPYYTAPSWHRREDDKADAQARSRADHLLDKALYELEREGIPYDIAAQVLFDRSVDLTFPPGKGSVAKIGFYHQALLRFHHCLSVRIGELESMVDDVRH